MIVYSSYGRISVTCLYNGWIRYSVSDLRPDAEYLTGKELTVILDSLEKKIVFLIIFRLLKSIRRNCGPDLHPSSIGLMNITTHGIQ